MPSWSDVLQELQDSRRVDALDFVRRKYLSQLAESTGRNVIAYYSGWLQKPGQFNAEITDDDKNAELKAGKIVSALNNHDDTLTHARHIPLEYARDLGLSILSMEGDCGPTFQDEILTVHHAYMHTFANSTALKIIENQDGIAVVSHIKA